MRDARVGSSRDARSGEDRVAGLIIPMCAVIKQPEEIVLADGVAIHRKDAGAVFRPDLGHARDARA